MSAPKTLSSLAALQELLVEEPASRVLLLCGPSRRFVDQVSKLVGDAQLEVFDGARVHVPRAVVDAASAVVRSHAPDTLVALGGGAATGLGKALRLTHDARFIAIPTTYAGSEMTAIWGVTEDETKRTGRDAKVRPDVVVHDPSLFVDMPRALTVTSLLNALAHPVGALASDSLDDLARARALNVFGKGLRAAEQLVRNPADIGARRDALRSAATAARCIEDGKLGLHHKLVHHLGGRTGAEHAALHAVLLPQTLAQLRDERPALLAQLAEAARRPDPIALLHDLLTRSGAPTSLAALDVPREAFEGFDGPPEPFEDALLGRRTSAFRRREGHGLREAVVVDGDLSRATDVVIAVHGRGANADSIGTEVRQIVGAHPDVVVVAPHAPRGAWYAQRYTATRAEIGEPLQIAIEELTALLSRISEQAPRARLSLFGFSQGACVALEAACATQESLHAVVAIAGARVGPEGDWPRPVALEGVRVMLAIGAGDEWVDLPSVESTASQLSGAGADVQLYVRADGEHRVTALQRVQARRLLLGEPDAPRGFGGAQHSEALPGAVPMAQNTPRHAPYGLYPEATNGTGFVAKRHANQRTWMYRVRPSSQRRGFASVAQSRITSTWEHAPETDLVHWDPLPLAEEPTDFVDGLVTVGGAGHPSLRRGYALHLYAANRSMDDRAFYSADGDLLLLPERGALTLLTELGALDVKPGEIAVLPRGLPASVLLHDDDARGYVGEVYAQHFALPERGLVGSNHLADERHFRAPSASYEDRLAPGYRVTVKAGGALLEAEQDYSPFDVAGWHGNYLPWAYDLSRFAPLASGRVDHPDPSILTVLSAGLDEQGAHGLDLVVFPPRWDPSENTFRPPFFHRNVTTEINGIVKNPAAKGSPFRPGAVWITPSMTPHGVMSASAERVFAMTEEEANKPQRLSDASLWFQFESALPFSPTRWALDTRTRTADWVDRWGEHGSRFDPRQTPEG
jgi:homogentisate 1,2-dioxygenase